MECAICFEENDPFILQCKHSVCLDCYPKIRSCPFCRKEIKKKKKEKENQKISLLDFLYKRLEIYFNEYLFS